MFATASTDHLPRGGPLAKGEVAPFEGVPFQTISQVAYELFMERMGLEPVPFNKLEEIQQISWEAAIRLVCLLKDWDMEDGKPDIEKMKAQHSGSWKPPRMRTIA